MIPIVIQQRGEVLCSIVFNPC